MDYPHLHIFLKDGVSLPSLENLKKWSGSAQLETPESASQEERVQMGRIRYVLSQASLAPIYRGDQILVNCSEMSLMLNMSLSSDIAAIAWVCCADDYDVVQAISEDLDMSEDFYSRICNLSEDHTYVARRTSARFEALGRSDLDFEADGYDISLQSAGELREALSDQVLAALQLGSHQPAIKPFISQLEAG
jgi:hypothetical protein